MAPPIEFSNRLARWVARYGRPAIVSVELQPRLAAVLARWETVSPVPLDTNGNPDQQETARRQRLGSDIMCSTGFIFYQDDDHVWLLTAVHMLEHLYSAHDPLTEDDIEEMYILRITCDHREEHHRAHPGLPREQVIATAYKVDCARDLMLFRITRDDMHMYCDNPHPPLPFAREFPRPLKTVVMISWPPNCHRRTVMGHASHPLRHYDDLNDDNEYNYQMNFSEANITSGRGSSGAPLLTGDVEVAGVLHGGDGFLSQYISLGDIRQTLLGWGFQGL